MSTRSTHREGFTLIELLVVIAIIAILAAILFPVFARAREKARQTTCISNQKQILLAIMQYTQDFDETYPLGQAQWPTHWDGTINSTDQAASIEEEIDPYIKAGVVWGPERNSSVWKCPSDSVRRDDCDGAPGIGTGYDISYAFTNYNPANPLTQFGLFSYSNGVPSQTLAGVGSPGDTVIMWDWWNPQAYSRYLAVTRTNMSGLLQFPIWPGYITIGNWCGDGYDWHFSIGSHNGMTNFGWADGHVKSMPATRLWNTTPNGIWNFKAPNLMHWDSQYHTS
jgi:prepilin-type N-terminal cleavage/methylation domain-containing protein/prepilin-type processing-associated H-X9-DG protein